MCVSSAACTCAARALGYPGFADLILSDAISCQGSVTIRKVLSVEGGPSLSSAPFPSRLRWLVRGLRL